MNIGSVSRSYTQPTLQYDKNKSLFIKPKSKELASKDGVAQKCPPNFYQENDIFVKKEPKKEVSFGYNNILKTLWKRGKLPTVVKGFYGGLLSKKNCSLEHLQCASQGGKTELDNLVLATKENNWARGDKPLKEVFNIDDMTEYLKQFIDVQVGNFNGNEYIKAILKKVSEIL